MKLLISVSMFFYLMFLTASSFAAEQCFSVCNAWDTFCKSPAQIVATKCRLGVPVKHDECKKLDIPSRYLVRGGGSLVEAMPCSKLDVDQILDETAKQ